MPLTDSQARKAVSREKDYKLSDSGGLYLFVTARGHKSWRLKYRFGDKERRLVIGPYPDVGLAAARERREAAKALLREHRDPAIEERKRKMAAHAAAGRTFKTAAQDWHALQVPRWSPVNATKVRQALERDVYPQIGKLPLTEIDGPTVLKMLRRVEDRGAIDTAKRIRQHVSAIFQYGMAEGMTATDPAAGIKKALRPTPPGGKQPAVKTIEEARELLAKMDASTSSPMTKAASWLLALSAARPGLVRAAQWHEFEGIDWTEPADPAPDAVWRISAERMKLDLDDKSDEAFEHVIPLPVQAVAILRRLRQLTGRFSYLFHSVKSARRPMSENTIGYMYARNGYSGRHVPHGWRASFSTIMNEWAREHGKPGDRDIIDAMLAHRPKGVSGSEMAYNRALHWQRRRELADVWAGMLTA